MIILKPKHPNVLWRGDVITLLLFIVLFLLLFSDYRYSRADWWILGSFVVLSLALKYFRKTTVDDFKSGLNMQLSAYIKAHALLILIVFLMFLLFPTSDKNRKVVMFLVVAFPILSLTINYFLQLILSPVTRQSETVKYTLVAGTGRLARVVENSFSTQKNAHYKVKGFINCMKNEQCQVSSEKIVSDIKGIHQYLMVNPVDEIIIALPAQASKKVQYILSAADYHGIRVKFIPDYQQVLGTQYKITRQGKLDVINVRQLPLDGRYSIFMKNSFDKAFSALTLTLLLPIFLIIAAIIKLDSKGPVFYCPTRIGRSGKAFKVFKFRSMRECDEVAGGLLSTQKDDPRVTRIGRLMRKYSIDELPQFINVLLGEMSVVGPRPHRSFLNQELQQSVEKYMIRHYFKPGITGWAQVNGWRGPTDTDEQKRQRTLHDLWYIENWTLALDMKIIFLTIFSKKVHTNAF